MTNITDPIRRVAERQPNAAALIQPDGSAISYAALERHIDRIGRRILALGFSPKQVVLMPATPVAAADEPLMRILELALARIGILVADSLPPGTSARAMLLPSGGRAPASSLPIVTFNPGWLIDDEGDALTPLPMHPGGETPLRIVSTSGTTGAVRYCLITHALMAVRQAIDPFSATGPSHRPVMICAMGGTAGLGAMLSMLGAGGTQVFAPVNAVCEAILRHGVTTLFAGPAYLQQVLAALPVGMTPPPSIESVVAAGSALPATLAEKTARMLCQNVVTRYGATETGYIAHGSFTAAAANLLGPGSGDVMSSAEMQAVDDDHRPLPPGQEGVLRVRTPGMIDGYLGDAGATAAAFRDGWFYPGDVGLVTAERALVLRGRVNEVINTGGRKVSPRPIEDVLLSFPSVTQAAVFGVPDADGLTVVWAAVVAEKPLDQRAFNQFCRLKLGPVAPRSVLQMQDLPRNIGGKVLVRELVELAQRQIKLPAHG